MPMTEVVRYLNGLQDAGKQVSNYSSKTPYISREGRVFAHYATLQLESRFHPILRTIDGSVYGHAASLVVIDRATGQSVDAEAVFVLPTDDQEFIYLDRLVRTLHALNYLTHFGRGNLVLRVHQRHVLSVNENHGLAFEEIVRSCGLIPEQITLEVDIEGVEDPAHFVTAIQSYHQRGYRIAIHRYGRLTQNLPLVKAVSPDVVRIDPRYLESPEVLAELMTSLNGSGSLTLIEGPHTALLRQAVYLFGIDLQQIPVPPVFGLPLLRS